MKSIRDLYKVGKGPSSSHTMGPERAARIFKQENPDAERYEVTLYGSLALTGVGHGTDRVLSEVLAPTPTEIIFSQKDPGDLRHPNTLDFAAYKGEEKFASMRVESIGGGDIVIEGRESSEPDDVYPENSFAEIAQYCRWRYISLREYVELNEGAEIWDFLQTIWHTMRAEVEEGLEATGILPGGLNVQRKARYLYERQHAQEIPQVRELQLVCAYAFAAAEQNAANGTIVTAPTCGSCGVLPAVLMYLQGKYHYSDLRMAHALGVAGIIGGTIISSLLTCVWFEPYVLMRYGIEEDWQKKLRRYFMDYIVRWVVVAGVSAVSYWIFQLMPQTNFLWFIAQGLIYTAIFAAVVLTVYGRTPEFQYLLEMTVRKLRKKLHSGA